MSFSQSFSDSYHYNRVADDSSTVFDADTVMPDEVPSTSLPAMPPLPMPILTATATTTDYLYNNNESISSTSIQEESPANTISELLRRINSRHRPAEPSTTTATAAATAARTEEISTNESSSSSSSKKRSSTNSSSHQSTKRPRRSSRLKRQQPQDQICTDDKSDSEVEDENGLEDNEPDEEISTNQSSSSQTSSTTKLTKYEANWRSMFQKLCDYKRLHGHANVLFSNKELGKWVVNQRYEYRNFKANKHSYMTSRRIEMLESIGFEWVSPNKGGQRNNESAWNKRFNELKDYKELHGHTNVSTQDEDNKKLGVWVSTQRQEYKKFKKNGKGKITPERIDLLNSIGFEWVSPNKGGHPRNESKWNKRFNELKEYKEKCGRTNVPKSENKQLCEWVSKQRQEYKKFQENKKSSMINERIQTLESIGFQWEVCLGRPACS